MTPEPAEIERAMQSARALRAQAFAALLRRAAAAIRSLPRQVARRLRCAKRGRSARRELARLDRRLLADAGMEAADIGLVVDGLLARWGCHGRTQTEGCG